MARPKSKPTTDDLLDLSRVNRLLRDEIHPILRRIRATYCLKNLNTLQASVRRALAFRTRNSYYGGAGGVRMVRLTEEIYREYLLARLRDGAATLAEYQAKHPSITHGLFMGKRLVKLGREG